MGCAGNFAVGRNYAGDAGMGDFGEGVTAMAELKPCPFCGGEAYLADQRHVFCRVYVTCLNCDCRTAFWGDVPQAIEAWNRRAGDAK